MGKGRIKSARDKTNKNNIGGKHIACKAGHTRMVKTVERHTKTKKKIENK